MSVYITIGGTEYRNVRSVSYDPQYDPRMESLPICEFSAEVVTSVTAEALAGSWANLYHTVVKQAVSGWPERDRCLAYDYLITEAEQIGAGAVKIKAKSYVYILDQRVLEAKMYDNTPIADFMYDVFEGPSVNGVYDSLSTSYKVPTLPTTVTMYCPQQTARERLLWFCAAYGKMVTQWGDYQTIAEVEAGTGTPYAIRVTDNEIASGSMDRITPDMIYDKPTVSKVSSYTALTMYKIIQYTQTEHTGPSWKKCVVKEAGELPDGMIVDDDEIWYINFRKKQYERQGAVFTENVAEISDELLIRNEYSPFAAPWFLDFEVELDVLWGMVEGENNPELSYMPGSTLIFATDRETRCRGIIKSVGFTFGKREKLHLVIVTDLEPLETHTAVIRYMYNGIQLGQHGPEIVDNGYYFTVPSIKALTPGGIMTFVPASGQAQTYYLSSDQDTDLDIQYTMS